MVRSDPPSWFTAWMTEQVRTRAGGVRARAREQMTNEILDVAKAHLAEQGATGLSLRAVARDVGMVSSALYRYFDSRDALLTALIVDAYNSLGQSVEDAQSPVAREDLPDRWRTIALQVRSWALGQPHLYALVYGSPVPGYAAPLDTTGPATRVTALLADLLRAAAAQTRGNLEEVSEPDSSSPLDPDTKAALAPLLDYLGDSVDEGLAMRGVLAWAAMFGLVSFELFGQLHNVVDPTGRESFFRAEVDRLGQMVGFARATPRDPSAN